VPGLLPYVDQVDRVDAVRDPSTQPMCCGFTSAVEEPCFFWPLSSSAPTIIRVGRDRRATLSSPAAAYRLTWLIVAASSRCPVQEPLRLSRRPVARQFRVRPAVRDGKSLTSAFRYFPVRSHICLRAKHDRASLIRADLSRSARHALPWSQQPPCPRLPDKRMIPRRLRLYHGNLPTR
jgi:hypothetical protein